MVKPARSASANADEFAAKPEDAIGSRSGNRRQNRSDRARALPCAIPGKEDPYEADEETIVCDLIAVEHPSRRIPEAIR